MALVLLDRAKETTTVVGTGTATLLGAVTSYQSLAGVGNGNTTYYCIVDQTGANWEVGIGTYTASGTTLARTTVLASSNAGALVVFTTGVKDVFVTYPSEKGVWYDASGNVLFTGTTTAANLAYTGTLTGGTGVIAIGTNQIYKDASGNVGIGTTTPTALRTKNLEVSSNGTNDSAAVIVGKRGTGIATVRLTGLDTTVGTDINFNFPNTGDLSFYDRASGLIRMVIDSSGNVGIGTSSPSYRLEVKGASATAGQLSIHDGTGDTTVLGVTAGSLLFQARDSSIRTIAEIDAVNTTTNGTGGAMVFQTRIADALAERMRIDSSGNLLVGTTSPYSSSHTFSKNPGAGQFTTAILNSKTDNTNATLGLLVKYTGVTPSDGNHIFRCEDSGGTQRFYVQNNGTYGGTSDARLKNNITDSTPKLSDLLNIKVRNFYWNDNENDKNLGFIAQEVEEIFPALIVEDDNGYKTIKHSVFTPMLVKAIQELKAIIDTQQEQINSLLGK